MFNCEQLTELVIKPTLGDLQMYSEDAVELLIFTCANESHGGTYLKQIKGPALGIYQMEPITYNDIWQNYIMKNQSILIRLNHNFGLFKMPPEETMIYDLRYATVMARLFYARIKEAIPDSKFPENLWNYYKTHYNTSAGKANIHDALMWYEKFKA